MASVLVIAVCVIALIFLTLRIHAEAAKRRRMGRKPSPEGAAPENVHYSFAGSDLWSQFGGHHSAHGTSAHSTHSDGGGLSGGDGGGGGGDGGGGGGG